MNDIEATKFYVRHREGYPETEMQYAAWHGFHDLNVETAPYEWVDDISAEKMSDLGPTVGVAGYVGDVWHALKLLGKPIPAALDYPVELAEFLGRKVYKTSLGMVRSYVEPVFVKPVVQKLFNGFVWQGALDAVSRRRVVTQPDDAEVWCSDVVDIVAEYRTFILYRKIVGCRLYKGDWGVAPNRSTIEAAVKAFGRKAAPHAYCLDFGVTREGRTILIEANEGYAFGHYGLQDVTYARMLSARWHELALS